MRFAVIKYTDIEQTSFQKLNSSVFSENIDFKQSQRRTPKILRTRKFVPIFQEVIHVCFTCNTGALDEIFTINSIVVV